MKSGVRWLEVSEEAWQADDGGRFTACLVGSLDACVVIEMTQPVSVALRKRGESLRGRWKMEDGRSSRASAVTSSSRRMNVGGEDEVR